MCDKAYYIVFSTESQSGGQWSFKCESSNENKVFWIECRVQKLVFKSCFCHIVIVEAKMLEYHDWYEKQTIEIRYTYREAFKSQYGSN